MDTYIVYPPYASTFCFCIPLVLRTLDRFYVWILIQRWRVTGEARSAGEEAMKQIGTIKIQKSYLARCFSEQSTPLNL